MTTSTKIPLFAQALSVGLFTAFFTGLEMIITLPFFAVFLIEDAFIFSEFLGFVGFAMRNAFLFTFLILVPFSMGLDLFLQKARLFYFTLGLFLLKVTFVTIYLIAAFTTFNTTNNFFEALFNLYLIPALIFDAVIVYWLFYRAVKTALDWIRKAWNYSRRKKE